MTSKNGRSVDTNQKYYPQQTAENGIYPNENSDNKTDECENSVHTDIHEVNQLELAINLPPPIEQIEEKRIPREGTAGLRAEIESRFIDVCQVPFVREYLKQKVNLEPRTLLLLVDYFDGLINRACASLKQNADQLTPINLFDQCIAEEGCTSSMPWFYAGCLFKQHGLVVPKKHRSKKTVFDHTAVNRCVKYLRTKGTAETSIKCNLINPVRRFFTWLTNVHRDFEGMDINSIPIWKVTNAHLNEDYKGFLEREVRHGRRTDLAAKRDLQYVKGFFSNCFHLGLLTKDITVGVTNIKADDYRFRELPSLEELETLFETIERYSEHPDLEVLAFNLMLHMALRMAEVMSLRWEDINLGAQSLKIRKRKGGKPQILPMPSVIINQFKNMCGLHTKGFVFAGKLDLYANYKLYARLANWGFPGGVHIFRHICITSMVEVSDPRQVAWFTGQESLSTLSKYVHCATTELQSAVDRLSKRGG